MNERLVTPARRGIPTMYKGVRFRSRAEARWAAFFDSLEWPWDYEPFDLNGYIPDFVVQASPQGLLVEVKAATEDFEIAQSKIEVSGWDGEAIVVAPTLEGNVCGRIFDTSASEWCPAEFFRCLSCGDVSVLASEFSWRCRRCGVTGGNAHVGDFSPADAWLAAGNRVQWRAD